LRITHELTVIYIGIVEQSFIYSFICSVKLWAQKVDRLCIMKEAGFFHCKYLCRVNFLPTELTTPEMIRLNRLAVPCGLDWASHSIRQSSPAMLPTLQLHLWLEIK